jgi:outer membrane receptor protein involved in Fe transport
MFVNPNSGLIGYGASPRPGVDPAASAFPNEGYGGQNFFSGRPGDFDGTEPEALTNGYNNEEFDQIGTQFDVTWDVTDAMTLKYVFGYSDFLYTFNIDGDHSNSLIADPSATTYESVYSYSHELVLDWDVTDKMQVTSGLYYFTSNRYQDFALTNPNSQNRVEAPADYGQLYTPNTFLGGASFADINTAFISPIFHNPAIGLGDSGAPAIAPIGVTDSGPWNGTDSRAAYYRHNNKNSTDQVAAFTQGTYNFNENWALTLGVRWAEDEKSVFEDRGGVFESTFPVDFLRPTLDGVVAAVGNFFGPGIGLPDSFSWGVSPAENLYLTNLAWSNILMGAATATGDPLNPIAPTCALDDPNCATPLRLQGIPFSWAGRAKDKDDWNKVTWRVNLDWTPNEETLVYLSTTTGYRAGGYGLGIADARVDGPTGLLPLSYDSEEVMAFELGYKANFFDGVLQVNSAIYRYDYENYQDDVTIYDPIQLEFRTIPTNTGDAVNQGFEVEVTWLATDNLTINGNYSYTDTEYQDDVFFNESDNPMIPSNVFPCPQPITADTCDTLTNVKGGSLKGIPEHKAALWGSYRWVTDIGTFVLAGSVSYTGEYNNENIQRDLDEIPDRTRIDASVIWTSTNDKTRVRAFVDNVTDERSYRGIGSGGAGNNYKMTGSLLYPRYWGLEARYSFGNG